MAACDAWGNEGNGIALRGLLSLFGANDVAFRLCHHPSNK
jgi:hypothetical protein